MREADSWPVFRDLCRFRGGEEQRGEIADVTQARPTSGRNTLGGQGGVWLEHGWSCGRRGPHGGVPESLILLVGGTEAF